MLTVTVYLYGVLLPDAIVWVNDTWVDVRYQTTEGPYRVEYHKTIWGIHQGKTSTGNLRVDLTDADKTYTNSEGYVIPNPYSTPPAGETILPVVLGVNYQPDNAGVTDPVKGSYSYPAGSQVTLKVTSTFAGFRFVDWVVFDGASKVYPSPTLTLTLAAAETIAVAHWEPIVNGNGNGTTKASSNMAGVILVGVAALIGLAVIFGLGKGKK